MYFSGRSDFKFLHGGNIRDIFAKTQSSIKQAIEGESENYILNVNEESYIEHIESKHRLDIPELYFDQLTIDTYEAEIPVDLLPNYFRFSRFDDEPKKVKKQVIQYYIPCTGNMRLLEYCPASSISLGGGGNGYFKSNGSNLIVELINYVDNAEEIRNDFKRTIESHKTNYNTLRKDILEFNQTLKPLIANIFKQQKDKFLKKNNLMAALGVPLRKKENVPSTFSIPQPQLREKIIVRPQVYEKGFKPEPVLDNENYIKILKIINDVGKNFERQPSISKGKDEETLRDHILMVLDPNFEYGSASGETFNKVGKTDIQLRHDSSVVFIAECKFWSGAKKYHSTIDQLLSYLTWRDSKTAIIIFVRQKEISNVLETVKNETPNHPNYLGVVSKSDENWFNYRFHLSGDKNRELKLSVLLFHLPD